MLRRWETDRRYYCVRVYRDLFGTLVVAKAWGGRRNNLGGIKIEPMASWTEALQAVRSLGRRRTGRRYARVPSSFGTHFSQQ